MQDAPNRVGTEALEPFTGGVLFYVGTHIVKKVEIHKVIPSLWYAVRINCAMVYTSSTCKLMSMISIHSHLSCSTKGQT